ncbi:hypothetical protein GCM10010425_25030 [Streptomyces spororaveus]|uniref:DUF397 domain-containing protein n=1 Tax=Streptomyces spororaveus TaxID=284039 RepID=A0ABQ3THY6_9ACTN|nr:MULTISPECIES: DUF397 domain-containing protein [Streptomyces]MCX5305472.1 DUF397 domain-containing protein [Streptomyces sp. NBC_00160]GHI79560.1 hypothetical protein Sspor_51210 [Streptomyces spororaveus]
MNSSPLSWFKSSYSSGDGDDCVEVAARAGLVHVRDSKVTAGPELAVTGASWDAFLAEVTANT